MGNQLETNGKDTEAGGIAQAGSLFAFLVDGLRYALPVAAVLAVAADEGEAGFAYRGRSVPVEDAADLGLGRPGARRGRRGGTILVVGTAEGTRAVRVDAVAGIVGEVQLRRWPPLLAPLVDPGFPGLAVGAGGALVLVDARTLLRGRGPEGSGAPGEVRETP